MDNATLVTSPNGVKVWASPAVSGTLDMLTNSQAGGIAAVHGYVPVTGYISCPTIDIQFISRINTKRLYKRRLAALMAITFEDIQRHIIPDSKLGILSEADQRSAFVSRMSFECASMLATVNNVRTDARRKGHDRCFEKFANGIKVHFITEKGADGYKHPVLTDGYPVVDSIHVMHVELNRKVIQKGVRKKVNSGVPVLVSKCIKKELNDRSVGLRSLALKPNNFESVTISKNVIVPVDIEPLIA